MRSMWSRKFWKNRIEDSLVLETKISRYQNKLNSFEKLIGQCCHMMVLLTTSVCSELIPRKNKSCIWSQLHDMDTYIFYAFSIFPNERPTAPDNSTGSNTQPEKLGDTYSQQNYVHSHIEISTSTTFQYTVLSMDVDVASQIPIFS